MRTRPTKLTVSVTENDFSKHSNDYDGLCLACGEWSVGDVEPDAQNYRCILCNEWAVMGAEEALLMGYVELRAQ